MKMIIKTLLGLAMIAGLMAAVVAAFVAVVCVVWGIGWLAHHYDIHFDLLTFLNDWGWVIEWPIYALGIAIILGGAYNWGDLMLREYAKKWYAK